MLNTFTIDSVTTGKILGNPAIDAYDLIQVYGYYDNNDIFVDDTTTIVFTTLANNNYKYTGINRQEFDTQIGIEQRTENVTLKTTASFQKYAKTEIDNINGQITLSAGEINDLEGRVATAEATLDSQGARLDVVSTNIDPETGDVLSLKRMNYELGTNGLIMDDGSGYKSVGNTRGTYYYDNDAMTGKYTKDGGVFKDLATFGNRYYGIDESLDVENFTKEDAMFVERLYEDENGVLANGHFANQ